VSDDLTVADAADALGTSPQTVRRLLREGELPGRRQPWGQRFVWVPSRKGVDEFLSQHGRLDGCRRDRRTVPSGPQAPASPRPGRPITTPWFLRPRGRASLVVVVLGSPLLLFYASARILPVALWFDELGHLDVFRRIAAAKTVLWLLVAGTAAPLVALNLLVALSIAAVARRRTVTVAVVAASVIVGTSLASSASGHWQTFLLWSHRQPFGVLDPMSGKDVGFFVFSLPIQLLMTRLLLWLIAVAVALAAIVYVERGELTLRPLRATYGAQVHVAFLAAAFLITVAWRLRLERYVLEFGQHSSSGNEPFAGARYVDVHVRAPGLTALAVLSLVAALACLAAPPLARRGFRRRAGWLLGVPIGGLVVTLVSFASWLPAVVQRLAVDPNPLHSEQPFIERSIAATRHGLGLDGIDVQPYSPGRLSAVDVSRARSRLADVQVWDEPVLESRMRDLVTETPAYRPEKPAVDIGPRGLTVGSARELDLRQVGAAGRSWANDHLAYTHGLGLPRFSGTGSGRPVNRGCWTRAPAPVSHGSTSATSLRGRRGGCWSGLAAPRSTCRAPAASTTTPGPPGSGSRAGSSVPHSRWRSRARTCFSRVT
jgi:hypothetical protein